MNFEQLNLDQWLIKLCTKINFQQPRPIQQLAIKPILQSQNTLISSETGSGKTAAFAFPILQLLSRDPYGIFAIVLTANRELALQIGEQFQIYGAALNLRIALLIGGLPIQRQIVQLSRIPHIVVGTPGRFLDLLQSDQTFQKYIKNIKFLVLDECDRLLEDQIWVQVEKVIQSVIFQIKQFITDSDYTVTLVSATLDSIKKEKEGHQSLDICFPGIKFVECSTNQGLQLTPTIKHVCNNLQDKKYILMPQLVKDYYLIYLIQRIQDSPKIIFVSTCHKCTELALVLQKVGIECVPLHSMLKQKTRIDNLRQFKRFGVKTMISTDVASRGLDIPDVKYVINWNVPQTTDDYIHRVGRTARGGKRGTAITLITQFDVEKVLKLEDDIGQKLEIVKFDEEKVLQDMSTLTKVMRKVKIQMAQDGTTDHLRLKQEERKQLKSAQHKGKN